MSERYGDLLEDSESDSRLLEIIEADLSELEGLSPMPVKAADLYLWGYLPKRDMMIKDRNYFRIHFRHVPFTDYFRFQAVIMKEPSHNDITDERGRTSHDN